MVNGLSKVPSPVKTMSDFKKTTGRGELVYAALEVPTTAEK